jgi:putative hydrolase of the HAD superfamily
VGVKKPHPEIFSAALQTAQVKPESALMIGDDLEADVLGALNVGMSAIHFNQNKIEEISGRSVTTIGNLKELKTLL